MLFKSNSLVRGMVLKGVDELKNPRMKVFGDKMLVIADSFLAYVSESGEVSKIRIDDIEKLGQTNLDCTILNNQIYLVGKGRQHIIRIQPKTTFTYVHSLDVISETEGSNPLSNPSLAGAGGRVFLLTDGMKNLYAFDFVGNKVRYETLKSIIGIEVAKNMKVSNIGERLYLVDDTNKILYKIDPQSMKLIDKMEF
jgi:hypothetical protein